MQLFYCIVSKVTHCSLEGDGVHKGWIWGLSKNGVQKMIYDKKLVLYSSWYGLFWRLLTAVLTADCPCGLLVIFFIYSLPSVIAFTLQPFFMSCVFYFAPNIPSTSLMLAFILIKVCSVCSLNCSLAQTLKVLAVHLEDTASLSTGPIAFSFFFSLINSMMYGCATKAKAYGN